MNKVHANEKARVADNATPRPAVRGGYDLVLR